MIDVKEMADLAGHAWQFIVVCLSFVLLRVDLDQFIFARGGVKWVYERV